MSKLSQAERKVGPGIDAKWDAVNAKLGVRSYLLGVACFVVGVVVGGLVF